MPNVFVNEREQPISSRGNCPYQIRKIRLDEDLHPIIPAWKKCNATHGNDLIHNDPEWLLEIYKSEKANVRVYLLEQNGELVGAVPFALQRMALKCQLGDLLLAKIPIRRLALLGYSLSIPQEEAAYDLLFRRLVDEVNEFDAIFMEYLEVDSFLWSYLQHSSIMKRSFSSYSRGGSLPHPLIRYQGSFDDYMQKFSGNTRRNRLREVKRLQEKGPTEVIRVTEPSDVDTFIDAAVQISQKSWQFNLLGWGIRPKDVPMWKGRLSWAARKGWLRSYLLKCDGSPCSFILGYHYGGRFYPAVVGHDPAWRDWSVGTVLQLLAIKDLFNENPPEIYDFATYAEYKMYFANDSYPEVTTLLFPRRAYPLFAEAVYRASCATSIKAGALLDRFNLKPKVRHLIRAIGGHASRKRQLWPRVANNRCQPTVSSASNPFRPSSARHSDAGNVGGSGE